MQYQYDQNGHIIPKAPLQAADYIAMPELLETAAFLSSILAYGCADPTTDNRNCVNCDCGKLAEAIMHAYHRA